MNKVMLLPRPKTRCSILFFNIWFFDTQRQLKSFPVDYLKPLLFEAFGFKQVRDIFCCGQHLSSILVSGHYMQPISHIIAAHNSGLNLC